jgi:hypothetical protein
MTASRSRLTVALALLPILSFSGAFAVDWGCHYGDSPSCPGFVDSGAWNPSGAWIQDIAKATLGTQECCAAQVGDDGGKPFYQVVCGIDDPEVADFAALTYELWGCPYVDNDNTTTGRMPWCSEAVCYWHHKAGMPYSQGYRNSDWFFSWLHIGTGGMINYYKTEESLSARGRWIDYSELDYENFWPGWNAPCPGAYVPIRGWDGTEFKDASTAHSMMIDEMTVHVMRSGRVARVEVSFLEGNAGNRVKNSRAAGDVRSYTPDGDSDFGNYGGWPRKIMGFGVDLNASGRPVYDTARLHWVAETVLAGEIWHHDSTAKRFADPYWDRLRPELVRYAIQYGRKGPVVRSSSPMVQAAGIPDGAEQRWRFPPGLDAREQNGVEVEIDLLAAYPLPVKALCLHWRAGFLPQGYRVQWAGADKKYEGIAVPVLAELKFEGRETMSLPIPVRLAKPGAGPKLRYLKFSFPKGTFKQEAELAELDFVFDVKDTDATENP